MVFGIPNNVQDLEMTKRYESLGLTTTDGTHFIDLGMRLGQFLRRLAH